MGAKERHADTAKTISTGLGEDLTKMTTSRQEPYNPRGTIFR